VAVHCCGAAGFIGTIESKYRVAHGISPLLEGQHAMGREL
jgi:hypothetical protein